MSIYKKLNKQIAREETKRQFYAENGEIKEFLKTYEKSYLNLNTGKFWDDKFSEQEFLNTQDSMTKEKISIIASLIPRNNATLLDLGIGQAYLEQLFSIKNINLTIIGIDISRVAIRRAKQKFTGKFIIDNIMNLNKHVKKGSVDTVVAIEVIEHIPPHKIFKLYKQISACLKPNGTFILSTPLNEGLSTMDMNPSSHVREYTERIIKTELKLANFKIEKIRKLYAFQNNYRLKKILSHILFNRWLPNNIIVCCKKI